MPDHEDSLGGETFSGEEQQDPAQQSLGDGATMGGDIAAHSLGDQSTFGDANVDDELFDDGMEVVDLTTRYTEESVLGKGGFGEVVLATDTRLGRKVAIKRILGKAARSKTAVQRFLTEAKSIATLSHNNIVQIYDYGRATDGPFLIMECVQGGSLLDLCRKGPIELDEAVKIFSQVCDGLAKAHAENIIHRDIKPANILMTEDGIPKLTDFGLAKDDTADTGMTMEGAVIGTLDFMPPEQRQGAEFTDHRSDLWSLAATFYQMLTGKSPKVINIAELPAKLQTAVAKSLEQSKDDRFQSAMEMREAILQAHSGKMDTSRSLGEGECPQCATPNPSHGKFCIECSAVLQVQCLECEAEIQIWNRACGDCGAQQTPLVDKVLADLKQIHDQAESLLADLEFDTAVEKAAVIASETDSRLQQFATWHEDFSIRLESSRTSEYARLEELLREALTHEQEFDYKSGLQTLGQVVPSLKNTTVGGGKDTAEELSNRLVTNQARLKELEGIVRERVTKREIAGLLIIVDELLTLKPDRPDVQKLRAQLAKREDKLVEARDTAITQAAQQLDEQQYAQAVATLNTVSEEVSIEQFVNLKTKASDLLNQLNTLRDRITTDVNGNQLKDLLPAVQECLTLKADQDDLVKLKQDLINRDVQMDARNQQIISQAQQHMQQLQFDAVVQTLDTISPEYQTLTTAGLSQQAQQLSVRRQGVLKQYAPAALSNRPSRGVMENISLYLGEIALLGIQDPQLQQMLDEAKARRSQTDRKLTRPNNKLIKVGIAAAGVLGFVSVVFWLMFRQNFPPEPLYRKTPPTTNNNQQKTTATDNGGSTDGNNNTTTNKGNGNGNTVPPKTGGSQFIADDGQSLWQSPTSGDVVSLAWSPPAGQLFIAIQVEEFLKCSVKDDILISLGPAFQKHLSTWETTTGFRLQDVKQMILSWRDEEGVAFPTAAIVVHLKDAATKLQILEKLGDPPAEETDHGILYQANTWSYLVPENGALFVMGTKSAMIDTLEIEGKPPLIRRALTQLIKQSDRDRHLTILFAPSFLSNVLFRNGHEFYFGKPSKIRDPLQRLLGDEIDAAMVSLHFDSIFYIEARMTAGLTVDKRELVTQLDERIGELYDKVEAHMVALNPSPYWRALAFRFPAMIAFLHKQTRIQIEDNTPVLNIALPIQAASNLIIASELSLASEPRSAVNATVNTGPALPKTIEEVLQYPFSVDIPQQDLNLAIADIANEVRSSLTGLPFKFEINIAGNDLMQEGITRNQAIRDFTMKDKPLAEVLTGIVMKANPDPTVTSPSMPNQKLIWLITTDPNDTGNKIILITTRKAAITNKYTLPLVFVE